MKKSISYSVYFIAAILLITGIQSKIMHAGSAAVYYLIAMAFICVIALPVLFFNLYRNGKTGKEIVLLYLAILAFLLPTTIRVMHIAVPNISFIISGLALIGYFAAVMSKTKKPVPTI